MPDTPRPQPPPCKLTARRVKAIFWDCLTWTGTDDLVPVFVEAVLRGAAFDLARLDAYRQEIIELLMELPDEFMEDRGDGALITHAALDRHGHWWAPHIHDAEHLFLLSIAIGCARFTVLPELWYTNPSLQPYIVVNVSPTPKGTLQS